jgi:hypothetical protein
MKRGTCSSAPLSLHHGVMEADVENSRGQVFPKTKGSQRARVQGVPQRQRVEDSRGQGFQGNTKIRFRGSKDSQKPRGQGIEDSRVPKEPGSKGSRKPRVQGVEDSRVRGFQRVPEGKNKREKITRAKWFMVYSSLVFHLTPRPLDPLTPIPWPLNPYLLHLIFT